MIKLSFDEVLAALEGRLTGVTPAGGVRAVSTDSRTVGTGELFFAIAGERFDGHDFVGDALARGACAAVVRAERLPALRRALGDAAPLIGVTDVIAALGRLAAFHRRQLAAEVVAVVGSNGKTTTKAMIDHILRGSRRGRCSPKSFNNRIGVPLTLLSAEAADEFLVVEIGTNAPGEIAALGALVQPDLAVITAIGEEHLEGLGDLEGVLAEECSLVRFIRPGGFLAVNIELPDVRRHIARDGLTSATFGRRAEADLRVSDVRYDEPWLLFTLNGRFHYRLHAPGHHNALNATGAAAVALRLGVSHEDIISRLESFALPPMRGEVLELGELTLVNDAYNANPHSALAAIELLESMPARARRIFVFGQMCELGPRSDELHRRVASRLREARLDHIMLVGPPADVMYDVLHQDGLFGPSVERCADVPSAGRRLAEFVREGDVVLLKASRAVGLDRAVEALRTRFAPAPVA